MTIRFLFANLGLVMSLLLITSASSYRERLIFSSEVGSCSLSVEADDESKTIRLRVRQGVQGCHIDKETMLETLKVAFSKTEPPKPESVYSSLYLGRIVDYPWLSQHLAITASKDPAWDMKRGKPANIDLYKYVNNLLSQKAVAGEIDKALEASGYRVIAATVEKVLVGSFRDVPVYEGKIVPGKVPFDAMVWFMLKKEQGVAEK